MKITATEQSESVSDVLCEVLVIAHALKSGGRGCPNQPNGGWARQAPTRPLGAAETIKFPAFLRDLER